ncbi:MAG: hypothetical protein J6K32_04845 [Clostridia bacterium]|nr:hypothetical protein [Clostridia bacterium]
MMKHTNIRRELLRTGMGCFLFASAISAVNMLILPTARVCHGYPLLWQLAAFAAAMLGFTWLSGKLRGMGLDRLDRTARLARPALILLVLIVQLILGHMMAYEPAGDNASMIRAATMLATDGDFRQYPDYELYFARYTNQWGFLLVLTALFRVFSLLGMSSFLAPLSVLQALLYTAGVSSCLHIARRLRGVRGEIMTAAMLALFLPLYLAAAVLYTDTFSLPFLMITLRLALKVMDAKTLRRQLIPALGCALCAFLGGQIKMTVYIALIAAAIVWALTLRPVRAAACVLLCAAVTAIGTAGVHGVILSNIVSPEMYAQHNTPFIHWVMMSIPTADNPYGGYTGDYGITWGMMEEGAPREAVMDSIYSRMKDRVYTLRYPNRLAAAALRKNAAYIGDGTFGMTEMLDDNPVRENIVSSIVLEGRPLYPIYSAVCSGVFAAHLALCAIGCLRDIRRRDLRAAMLQVAAFGAMLFLMLWEARSRYLFSFTPVFLLLSAAYLTREEQPRMKLRERFAPLLILITDIGDRIVRFLRRAFGPGDF